MLQRKDREFAPPVYDSLEEYEPRIITDPALKPKLTNNDKSKKKIARTRYISTELGIREKLVNSIITSSDSFKSLGRFFNILLKLMVSYCLMTPLRCV